MIKETVICDECKKVKGEANHWRVVRESGGSILIMPWESGKGLNGKVLHLCGAECVMKAVSREMWNLVGRVVGQ